MSQFFQGVTAGSLPPVVPTSFVTDNGTAIPVANILNLLANDVTTNNLNGIQTIGSGNTVYHQLTNRFGTTATTTDAATTTSLLLFTYPLEGTYTFEFNISAYNVTDQLAASYWIQIGRRSNGSSATSYGIFNLYENEETTMSNVVVDIPAAPAVSNQFQITVNGLAGKTINWTCTGLYNFAGV